MSYFDAKDIAIVEHEFIEVNDLLETQNENMMWYLAGVHDFAEKLIKMIREKEGGA